MAGDEAQPRQRRRYLRDRHAAKGPTKPRGGLRSPRLTRGVDRFEGLGPKTPFSDLRVPRSPACTAPQLQPQAGLTRPEMAGFRRRALVTAEAQVQVCRRSSSSTPRSDDVQLVA